MSTATATPARTAFSLTGSKSQRRPEFAVIAQQHLDTVYRFVLHMVGNQHTAQDLTSQSFEKALKAWPRYDHRRGAQPSTWLCQIARNTVIDFWRGQQRRPETELDDAFEPAREDQPVFDGFSPALQTGLARLSSLERQIVALRVVLDFPCADAAAVVGISPTACSSHLHRALNKLRQEVTR